MKATITSLEAEKAIMEGQETAKLRRENAKLRQELEKAGGDYTHEVARRIMAENMVRRDHRAAALRYDAMRQRIKDERSDRIDMFIIGMGFGMMISIGVLSYIVYAM